jgi:hypothetical protein
VRRIARWTALVVAALVLLGLAAGVVWTQLGPDPTPEAVTVARAADVQTSDRLVFVPDGGPSDVGVVLYPGARVDATAYAPVARQLSRRSGALVAVVDPPLDVALLDRNAAADVIADHPAIDRWVVGGHSLGGVAAAMFAAADADVGGLALWAAYPADGTDLPDDLPTLVLTGTRDEILDRDAFAAARPRLPEGTDVVALQGVNHAQFGAYGPQRGDGEATTSDATAQGLVVDATAGLIARVRATGAQATSPAGRPAYAPVTARRPSAPFGARQSAAGLRYGCRLGGEPVGGPAQHGGETHARHPGVAGHHGCAGQGGERQVGVRHPSL